MAFKHLRTLSDESEDDDYLHLDHVSSLGAHLTHKIENVHCFRFFDHIEHCKNSNECASSAHTSTKIK